MMRALTAAALALAALVVPASPATAASPSVMLMTGTAEASSKRVAKLSLHCVATKTCEGSVVLRVAGSNLSSKSYKVSKSSQKSYSFTLSKKQYDAIGVGGSAAAQLTVTEKKPAKVASRGLDLTLTRPGSPTPPTPTPTPTTPTPTTPVIVESEAYKNRNWTPMSFDTCPASLHRKYSVIGPDGKLYPTWHPATDTDPATGKSCTYGHEHGDDPAKSDLYTWVTDFLDADATKSRGIPFGYVSEALTTYAAEHDHVTRHEDNVGHKIIVANNIKLVAKSPRGYVKNPDGSTVECDFLVKVHQGTHSGDALINNAHELLYAAKCNDGTELISSSMTRFGNANEFHRSCDGSKVTTSGSNLPDGTGGQRRIPDRFCIDRDVLVPAGRWSSIWSIYEVWESTNDIRLPNGDVLASFDPWFGVRNPARAHAGGLMSATLDLIDTAAMEDGADGGRAKGEPWTTVQDHEAEHGEINRADPLSPFDGAQRDYYLHRTTVSNPTSTKDWHTDPYGEDARASPAAGLVRQRISATDNSAYPDLERRSFDLDKDHGKGNGVHAPN